MTILSVCQEAAVELNQAQPSTLFSSTDPFNVEIRTLANVAAEAIAKAYDWQKLQAISTMTGDGTTTSFTLPTNYDRMTLTSKVLTSQFASAVSKARDLEFWLDLQINGVVAAPGYWIITGGTFQILPALATAVTAKFYYIKNTLVTGAAAAQQVRFLADADTFNLPERLLRLALIWRWRAMKRMEYAEDLANFELAMAEETAKDKGSRILVVGRQRMPFDAEFAHPAIDV